MTGFDDGYNTHRTRDPCTDPSATIWNKFGGDDAPRCVIVVTNRICAVLHTATFISF
jgi:hypothetical protein